MCLLIADDLTGACDAAVHFAARGLSTSVLLEDDISGADVLAINTESRHLDEAEIRRRMSEAAARLPARELLFKKIDSTLRGNAGVEIAAALEAFQCEIAMVCPAYPAMGRVVEAGWLRAPGLEPIDVAEKLGLGGRARVMNAVCNEDLERIVAEGLHLGRRVLWVGSGGLAWALARAISTRENVSIAPPRGPVLFCIGSDHPVTIAQQEALLVARPEHAGHVMPPTAVIESIHALRPAAIFLCGGDTAALVCRTIGARRIDLYDEIVPGIPRGVLRGGVFDGTAVATKSGGFGSREDLIRVADYFLCPNQPLR